jgi:hypothetical protein
MSIHIACRKYLYILNKSLHNYMYLYNYVVRIEAIGVTILRIIKNGIRKYKILSVLYFFLILFVHRLVIAPIQP